MTQRGCSPLGPPSDPLSAGSLQTPWSGRALLSGQWRLWVSAAFPVCSPGTPKAVKAQSGHSPLSQTGRPASDGSTSNRGACSPNLLVWDSQDLLWEIPVGHQSGSNQKVFTTLST